MCLSGAFKIVPSMYIKKGTFFLLDFIELICVFITANLVEAIQFLCRYFISICVMFFLLLNLFGLNIKLLHLQILGIEDGSGGMWMEAYNICLLFWWFIHLWVE